MTPIIADGVKLAAVVAVFSLVGGLALGFHALRGGKLWREHDGKE